MAAIKIPPNKYRDAIDQVIAYNSKILLERRLRYPYIDGQTGVAQQDCHLWVSRVARSAPNKEGQVCSYPARRWRVRKRPDFDKLNRTKVKQESASKTRFSSSTTNNEMFEPGPDETSMSSISSDKIPKSEVDGSESSQPVRQETSKPAYECEDPEDDFLSDYNISDDEFTPSRRKKRKEPPAKKGKKNSLAWRLAERVRNLTREEVNRMGPEERKKPYMCEICFKRYKNTQGIRYHYQHYDHDAAEEGPSSQTENPEVPSSEKKETGDASKLENVETSAYCDFCLGDARENKKTGTKEELISCSDCGRSGHPSCLQFTDKLIIEVKKYKWQCIECKSCSLCGTSDNDDQLLFCDECDRGYHMYCLTPKMSEPPEGHWCCKLCEERMRAAGEYPPPGMQENDEK
eukprot:Seg1455.5 transcript_id=Seg1455.5/GoldUCD/mRNA.D3Y31 product="Zinc finger protein ubi-d4" protein_id=Seg1455.5/GoldUCD/D3Y31